MVDPTYNAWLRIEHLDSQKIALENGDVWGYALQPPVGWNEGDTVLVQPPGERLKTSVVKNRNKNLNAFVMSFMGNVLVNKSGQPETEKSVEEKIRMDRELIVTKKYPGDVIRVDGGTKWQINRTGEIGRRVEIEEGDTVLMTKSTFPRKTIVKMYVVNKKNHELGGTFMSEA